MPIFKEEKNQIIKKSFSKMLLKLSSVVLVSFVCLVSSDHDGSSDPLDWLRDGVPGEPGVDYPIFAEIQETSFSCAGRLFGGDVF